MATSKAADEAQSNYGIDFVIVHKGDAAKFERLVVALAEVGISSQVRNGEDQTLLVFTRVANKERLYGEVYRSRIKDWLHGVRSSQPEKELEHAQAGQDLYPAERLRIIYQLITNPRAEGGAGITPGHGEWTNVQSIFTLHDHQFNNELIKNISRKTMMDLTDLDSIRDYFGEKVAFYFAFTQAYFTALIGVAAFGASAWLLLGYFHPVYAIVNSTLCVIFIEWWKSQEYDLAVRWGVRNVSTIESTRHGFQPEQEFVDEVTGERVQHFPAPKRLQRQLLQIPFAAIVIAVLGALIATCFGIEIFISEVYNGPLKWILVFIPTGILTTIQPLVVGILTKVAERLTTFENYKTDADHEKAMIQKIFIINFITSYLPVFLTAFVYVPFASVLVPYLDVFSLTVRPFADNKAQLNAPKVDFQINPSRLRSQVIYFTVTAQIVNQILEVVIPFATRHGLAKYKDLSNKRNGVADVAADDPTEEKAFLKRVRFEATLPTYDVAGDFREMVVQYGYLSLFSVVWSLTGVSFLVNDWMELRTDAFKICRESQRPIPWRADSIGPWLDSLEFLTWLGTLSTGAIVYMFQNDQLGPGGSPETLKAWALLLTIFFSEHTYLVVRWMVRTVISKLDSPGRQMERSERIRVRSKYLEESLGEQAKRLAPLMNEKENVISRESLEEEARQGSLQSSNIEGRFWARQRGVQDTLEMGKRFMEKAAVRESKKSQ